MTYPSVQRITVMDILKALLDHRLEHVTEHIFSLLEDPTVAQCRLVSRLWNSILQREWLVRKISHFFEAVDVKFQNQFHGNF